MPIYNVVWEESWVYRRAPWVDSIEEVDCNA